MWELIAISIVAISSIIRWLVIRKMSRDRALNIDLSLFLFEMFVIGVIVGISSHGKIVFLLLFIALESVVYRRCLQAPDS